MTNELKFIYKHMLDKFSLIVLDRVLNKRGKYQGEVWLYFLNLEGYKYIACEPVKILIKLTPNV